MEKTNDCKDLRRYPDIKITIGGDDYVLTPDDYFLKVTVLG